MRVTKFALVGDETVDLPITQVSPSDKFILKDISGLGPPDVLVNIGTTTYPQGVYQGSKPQPRQMIATIGLNPDYFSGRRSRIYERFCTAFLVSRLAISFSRFGMMM